MIKKRQQLKQGFSLLEVMLSVFVVTVGILGIYGLAPRLITTSFNNKDQFIASQLAQEGAELVRNIREENWLSFRNWNTGLDNCPSPLGCEIDYTQNVLSAYQGRNLKIDSQGFYNYTFGDITKYKRKIIITSNNWAKEITIEVQISGLLSGKTFVIISKLYNWI